MLVINLFGPPSAGKTTVQADVFRRLKQAGVNCEMIPELAKKLVWEQRWKTLRCQPYIFGKTLYEMQVLADQVDVLVLDSPLMLCSVYDSLAGDQRSSPAFEQLVADTHATFDNISYMLTRTFAYETVGRQQDADQANVVADLCRVYLDRYGIPFADLRSDNTTGEIIASEVLTRLS